jgi:hypothetical protein
LPGIGSPPPPPGIAPSEIPRLAELTGQCPFARGQSLVAFLTRDHLHAQGKALTSTNEPFEVRFKSDAWVEGDKLHAFKVTSATTAHLMAVFVTAQGDALRTDQPAPSCDTGNLGL